MFIIEKYKDDWYVAHYIFLDNKRSSGFGIKKNYLCDTIDGVIQLLNNYK